MRGTAKPESLPINIITRDLGRGRRIIYQYRKKRAALDLRNIEKQIVKAEHIVTGHTHAKRAKFVTVKTKALAGIKGYVTNVALPDDQIIFSYHQLWHVEQSFRVSKSDLRARPIFHHKRDSIEAHLTIVFAALAIGKMLEYATGMSIKKFVRKMRPIRSGIVAINGKEYQAEAEISTEIKLLLSKLRVAH